MSWILRRTTPHAARQCAVLHLRTLARVARPRLARQRDDPLGYSLDAWRAFGEQGYAATLMPEAHGGLGLGVCEAGLIAEQIGHTLAPTPFPGHGRAGRLAAGAKAGSAAQQQAWLPRMAAAQVVLALAVDEGPEAPSADADHHRGARR
jgi:alkylation response protein AidB-like acyl-CoA dehydrogenase